ncbi:MAG TPA: phosphoribosyltransferase family protein [Candidatus Acidoferrales bacterium]|nr:phosphoribosyltransferase family protein [Candidatus Acidoferrales bacterium]
MNDEVIELLKKTNAIYTDSHFVGTSGRHMAVYINKDALYPHTAETSRIGELFAIKNKKFDIDVVAGPALGGIILSTWTAYHLSQLKKKEILGVYTEKDAEKNQIFTRGYDKLVKGKNVLIIEDLTTTGGSVKKVVNSVNAAGGKVVQVCVMVNRDPENITSETIGAPFSSLAVLKAESWDEKNCPLCKKNIPVDTRVGHGKKYLAEKAKQK